MDKRTRLLYTPDVLSEAMRRFAISPGSLHELDGFESFIYEFEKEGHGFILRISHSLHIPPDITWGEIDFLRYLADNGLSVNRPQPSGTGSLLEIIPVKEPEGGEETYFMAAVFDRAPGRPPRREDWTPPFIQNMGRFLGRYHTLSREYQPSNPKWTRHHWFEDEEDYADRYLPENEDVIRQKFNALVSYLKALPRHPTGYGLIHLDFHGGNFFIENGKITLFDFGDCAYGHYAYDIAMALFYVVPHRCETPEGLELAGSFYTNFMKGYREEFDLDPAWLKEIPHFLKLREMDLYILIHRSLDMDNLDPWCASFMDGRKERLENDVPYIAMEF
jgi:amicoumacin kinase